MRPFSVFAILVVFVVSVSPSMALESYPPEIADQFTSWCLRDQSQPPSVCSCALNKAVLEIPTSAMASFLTAAEGGGMTSTMTGVGATAVSIVATCATSTGDSGTASGGMLKSLGTSLGQ